MATCFMTPFPKIGSMAVFWRLIEPVLTALRPARLCEIGVAKGAFSAQLLRWAQGAGCAYVGIDPAPDPEAAAWFSPATPGRTLCTGASLAVLPTLDRCDAYFLDGDHNYFTVSNELAWIARGPGAVVFVHDVGWPWARRDMYYLPSAVPAEGRQPWSETLGVVLDQDALVDGGMREPGRYAIALGAGGPRNGVLTAVEDFLAGPDGASWAAAILPVAYGLAVLCRPAHPSLPAACRRQWELLQTMAAVGGGFLDDCEHNYLQLYLFGEHAHYRTAIAAQDLERESAAHRDTLSALHELRRAHADLLAHNHALEARCRRLV